MDIREVTTQEYLQKLQYLYPNIEELFNENPYCLLDSEYRLDRTDAPTFKEIDSRIILKNFELRKLEVRSACLWVLSQNEQSGHSWIQLEDFEKKVKSLLASSGHPLLNGSVKAYIHYYNELFSFDNKRQAISLLTTKEKEYKIYHGIKSAKKNIIDFSNFRPIDYTNMLSPLQLSSADNIVRLGGNISLLTGGPGTGKTTIIKTIVNGLERFYPNMKIALLAPTGKAANRIADMFIGSDLEISTIHLFIGWGQPSNKLKKIKDALKGYDVILIDEASMISVDVLSMLFSLIDTTSTKLIFVGDEHQLPAIGTGDTINDLKQMGVYEEHLTINYRSNSAIIKNAQNMMKGDFRIVEDDSFQFIDIDKNIAKELLTRQMAFNDSELSSIVLSPYRKDYIDGSIYALNTTIHDNIYGTVRRDFVNGFCIGDRVILVNTNYKEHYFNGDTGILKGYKANARKIQGESVDAYVVELSNGKTVYVTAEEDIELAYAITIHKSQGSEYDIVNIFIPEYSPFISREMLYTAITRAKSKVILWTSKDIYKKIALTITPKRKTMISLWNTTDSVNKTRVA